MVGLGRLASFALLHYSLLLDTHKKTPDSEHANTRQNNTIGPQIAVRYTPGGPILLHRRDERNTNTQTTARRGIHKYTKHTRLRDPCHHTSSRLRSFVMVPRPKHAASV